MWILSTRRLILVCQSLLRTSRYAYPNHIWNYYQTTTHYQWIPEGFPCSNQGSSQENTQCIAPRNGIIFKSQYMRLTCLGRTREILVWQCSQRRKHEIRAFWIRLLCLLKLSDMRMRVSTSVKTKRKKPCPKNTHFVRSSHRTLPY